LIVRGYQVAGGCSETRFARCRTVPLMGTPGRDDSPARRKAMSERRKVVIIGGGFGGLSAAQHLNSNLVDVTLIDRRNYHLFQPLLYQVATGSLSAGEIASPLRSVLS